MLLRLLLLFIVVPFVELALLMYLANQFSLPGTLLLVVITGIVGTMLARAQGFATYKRIQQELAQGRMPTDSVFDAVLIFVAGAFLLTPGILTDTLGFSLLVPFLRNRIKAGLMAWVKKNFKVTTNMGDGFQHTTYTNDEVIDSHVVEAEPKRQIDP
ncbi:MAG: FxsA family protein [Pirellulales bacterium]